MNSSCLINPLLDAGALHANPALLVTLKMLAPYSYCPVPMYLSSALTYQSYLPPSP